MNFTTYISRSSSTILKNLARKGVESNATLIFSLSANASNVEDIASKLGRFAQQTIGCLSSPHPSSPDVVVCSVATFPSKHCIPFRSSIPGRPPVMVGRWSRMHVSPDQPLDLSHFPPKGEVPWCSSPASRLPSELLGHEREIETLIFFSDDAPEGLVGSLRALPEAKKLGLIGTSTPFINGQQFSLFHNRNSYSSGAVGLALLNYAPPMVSTSFPGLIPISKPMTVSKTTANLIHKLNHSNPSRLLADAIITEPQHGFPDKEEEFYVGHLRSEPSAGDRISRVYRILSGDPSRGTIALEADMAPPENEIVQFFRRDPTLKIPRSIQSTIQASENLAIRFICSPRNGVPGNETNGGDDLQVLHNAFLVMSENGFLCSETTESKLWTCNIQGASSGLEWAPHQ